MKNRHKLLIFVFVLIGILAGIGVTYSLFRANNNTDIDQNIAKFVFNTESLDEINLTLNNLNPTETKEYDFSVSNKEIEAISDVIIQYRITLKTYHFIPLNIALYEVGTENVLILNCDETYSRDVNNQLVCNTDVFELGFGLENTKNYKLVLEFPEEYNTLEYSSLTDFITLNISSWQKLG